MSLGRRKVQVNDQASWVFNKMAHVYSARPAYPAPLIEAIASFASVEKPIGDLGAGVGHLSLPLAERGFQVVAVEPAAAMLERLRADAAARSLGIELVHAAAESLPLPDQSLGLVVVADALHFMDKELAALEIARVLASQGAVAIVTSEFADTPFMRGIVEIMESAAPRRPRKVEPAVTQLLKVAGIRFHDSVRLEDRTPVDPVTLERLLCSISFIGPAMNAARFAEFRRRILAVPHEAVWARRFTLHAGRRGKRPRGT